MISEPTIKGSAGPTTCSPCQYLAWDSDFFGCRVARFNGHRLTAESLADALEWCRREGIDCVYFLCEVEPETVSLAEAGNLHLVDIRVTLVLNGPAASMTPDGQIRRASADDIADLRRIAGSSHTDSRFYSDAHFPREHCDELYRTWIEKSCQGFADQVFVAEYGDRPAGYLSCHVRDAERGSVGLVAVAAEARDRGFGQRLLQQALGWFHDQGITRVDVVTQGRNTAALRVYERAGFGIDSVQLWYHLWPGRIPETASRR